MKIYNYLLLLLAFLTINIDQINGMTWKKKRLKPKKEFIVERLENVELSPEAQFHGRKSRLISTYKKNFAPEGRNIFQKKEGTILPDIEKWYDLIKEIEIYIETNSPEIYKEIFLKFFKKLESFNAGLIDGVKKIQESAYAAKTISEWGQIWEVYDLTELEKVETMLNNIKEEADYSNLDAASKKEADRIIELLDVFARAISTAIREATHEAFKRLGKRTESSSEKVELQLQNK